MKKTVLFTTTVLCSLLSFAQNPTIDSTKNKVDTIKVGNFIIVKKHKDGATHEVEKTGDKAFTVTVGSSKRNIKKNVSTNWWIVDLGFTNVRENTNYAAAATAGYFKTLPNGTAVNQNSFSLNNGKSSNVNIWLFMQKVNIAKHKLNLKYGLGLEMYNFRYDTRLSYRKDPQPFVFNDSIGFSKNKLYAGYATVPLMLNFQANPAKRKSFSASIGVSAGYLISSRNKQISNERGKDKIKGNLNLDPWRFATIAELGLGPVRLYGSYSFNALHKSSTGLDQTPYAVGVRFSNW